MNSMSLICSLLFVIAARDVAALMGSCREAKKCCEGKDPECGVTKADLNSIIMDPDDAPCYCDHNCLNMGDCCPDFKDYCGGGDFFTVGAFIIEILMAVMVMMMMSYECERTGCQLRMKIASVAKNSHVACFDPSHVADDDDDGDYEDHHCENSVWGVCVCVGGGE